MKLKKKLNLSRETLRALEPVDLDQAAGGTYTTGATNSIAVCPSQACGATVGMGACAVSNNSCGICVAQ